mgnify:CR=1 FL=1
MAEETANNIEFRVPKRFRLGFVKLATASDDIINSLLKSCETCPPALRARDLALFAYNQYSVKFEDSFEILQAVLSLYSLREKANLSTEELIQHILKALQTEDDEYLNLSEHEITKLENRLNSFLSIYGNLEISSKSSELLVEHQNIYSASRIISDIRPIFNSDRGGGLGGALIIHTLKVSYQTASGQNEFFVALDSNDLRKLSEDVNQALQKEQSIQSFLEESEIPYLDTYRDSSK